MKNQPGQDQPRISYAQNMEDILLDRLFQGRVGTFVDVGANHPVIDNNTYFFYLRGWRGVNIEPSPACQALFRESRPDDSNLGVAVSDSDGETTYFDVRGPEGLTGLSTLSHEVAETHRASGYEVTERPMPLRTLATLVAEHGLAAPDLLSIDVESHEGAVIRGIPWETWRPGVLVIESTDPLSDVPSHRDWEPILLANGYLFAAFNGVNRFYLRDDLWDLQERLRTPVSILDNFLRHDLVQLANKAAAFEDRFESEKAARAFEQAQHEELRQAWEWGRVQSQHAQAVWEKECASFAKERASWADALAFFEAAQGDFREKSAAWDAERASWDAERAAWHAEREQFDRERAGCEAERTRLAGIVAEAEGALKPYRLIDRFGVVRAGYGLAQRMKHRLVS